MIRSYLGDIINNDKSQGESKIHSDNEAITYKPQEEQKTQLTKTISFISSKNSDEIRTDHTKRNNI